MTKAMYAQSKARNLHPKSRARAHLAGRARAWHLQQQLIVDLRHQHGAHWCMGLVGRRHHGTPDRALLLPARARLLPARARSPRPALHVGSFQHHAVPAHLHVEGGWGGGACRTSSH